MNLRLEAGILPIASPAHVRLEVLEHVFGSNACWSATIDDVRKNTPEAFNGRGG